MDPNAVRLMIHYFYHLDYPEETPDKAVNATIEAPVKKSPSKSRKTGTDTASPSRTTATSSGKKLRDSGDRIVASKMMSVHVQVYALGEMYDIQGLKALALEKFKRDTDRFWNSNNHKEFLDAVGEVYTSTMEHDKSLRNAVVDIFVGKKALLKSPEAQDVVKSLPDLSFDLTLRLHKDLTAFIDRSSSWCRCGEETIRTFGC